MAKQDINQEEKLNTAKKIASRTKNTRTAYDSLEEGLLRIFRWLSSIIDRLFFSKKYLSFFALLLACLSYFVVTYDSSSLTALSSSKTLTGVSINPRYNSETFEISGVPNSCEVVITGEAANVNTAAAKKGYCQINLEGYTEGTHNIAMSAVGYGDNVNTIVSPSTVTITLKKKTTMQFDLSYDYINQNELDSRYILSIPSFASGTKINIRASQDTLNSIVMVKALIDVAGQSGDFESEAPLVAYDKYGKAVNAEIVPSSVVANVKVTSPSKEVEIKLNVTGSTPNSLAINEVLMDHESTIIYGQQNIIDNISEVYVDFDLSNVTSTKEIMLPVILPTGVRASDVTMVNLSVSLTDAQSIKIDNIPIEYEDNNNNLAISDVDATVVTAIINGSANNIDKVKAEDISVYFSMKDLEPGTYALPLTVVNKANPYVSIELEKQDINVTLVKAGN